MGYSLGMSNVTYTHGIVYRNESKPFRYRYVLLQPTAIRVPGYDFGCWRAAGAEDRKTYIEASGDKLTIHAGYAWDGCTHAVDASWNMRASLYHDALYQAKKCGFDTCAWWTIDNLFREIMKQDGASLVQRNTYYYAVRTFGALYKLEKLDSLVPACVFSMGSHD